MDDPANRPLLQPTFVLLVLAQAAFALGWSVFLLIPKFMSEAIAADPAQIGGVSSAGNLAAIASIPAVGQALDRWGRRFVFAAGCILCAIQALAYLFIHEVGPLLYAAQMVWAISFVMAFNAGNAMVVDEIPTHRLGQALGIFGVANIVMNAVASVVVENTVDHLGWMGTMAGASAFASFAWVLSWWMPPSVPQSQPPKEAVVFETALLRLWVSSLTWGIAYAATTVFFQPFVLSRGIRDVSDFFVGFAIGAVFVRLILGRWVDRWGGRRIACVSLVLYGGGTVALQTMTSANMLFLGAWIGIAHGFLHPALSSLAVEGRPAYRRGSLLAYTTGSFMAGCAIGSASLGAVAESAGYVRVFEIGGAVALVGLLPLLPGPLGRPWRRVIPHH